jgi:hypothetical protein
MMKLRYSLFIVTLLSLVSPSFGASDPIVDPLAEGLRPFLEAFGGKQAQFTLSGTVKLPIDGKEQNVKIQLIRFDDEAFDLALTHDEYAVSIRRRKDATAFALPLHNVAFIGSGQVSSDDSLKPSGIASRLLSPGSQAAMFAPLIFPADANAVNRVRRRGIRY